MTESRIMESINTAKEIISNLMESDTPVYSAEHKMLSEFGEIQTVTREYTFSSLMYVYPRKAVAMLRNLLFNSRNTLPIRVRIALAALLETSVFDNVTCSISVYFGVADWYNGNEEETVEMYKWFSKNWGKFDINIHFTVDPEYALDEDEEPRTISLMTGEWKEV